MSKNIFYFSGEDGGITDFLPVENLKEIEARLVEFKKIDDYKDGFKKKYNGGPFKIRLAGKNIDIHRIHEIIGAVMMPYDAVCFEFTPEEVEKKWFAYHYKEALIIGLVDENNKKIVWLEFIFRGIVNKEDVEPIFIDNVATMLNKIGVDFGLVLLDWHDRKVVILKDRNEVMKYLESKIERSK